MTETEFFKKNDVVSYQRMAIIVAVCRDGETAVNVEMAELTDGLNSQNLSVYLRAAGFFTAILAKEYGIKESIKRVGRHCKRYRTWIKKPLHVFIPEKKPAEPPPIVWPKTRNGYTPLDSLDPPPAASVADIDDAS